MENYFKNLYPSLSKSQTFLLPNLLPESACRVSFGDDTELKTKLIKPLRLHKTGKVILFAGSFKFSAGVLELIKSFQQTLTKYPDLSLILIGDGPTFSDCFEYVQKNELQSHIQFLGLTPHNHLPVYQSIADIIICPDQMNSFSDKIVHLKYLDALLANKVVINGDFNSVLEINKDENLSVGFNPSSPKSLTHKILRVLENFDNFKVKYSNTRKYACMHLTYKKYIENLPPSL